MNKEIRKRLREDFIKFIKSQTILGVAIGILIGQAFAKLINSIIEGLLMPVLELFFPGDITWQHITLSLGKLHIKIGLVIAATLDFLLISLVVFFMIKFVLKEEDKFITRGTNE